EQPASAKTPEFAATLEELDPEVAAVVAYGKILPAAVLDIPRFGFVNLHFSLLPEYRGAAPVQRAVMEGKKTTGASTMLLTEGMDEGPVLGSIEVEIEPDESASELGQRLAVAGAPLLVESVTGYVAGSIQPVEQDDARATYAAKITDEEAHLDWQRSVEELSCFVRGLDPSPGAWTILGGRRLRIFNLSPADADLASGEVAAAKNLLVGCGDGSAVIDEAQLQGKRRMTGRELANGLHLSPGERVE
ncbi:MAG: methionyl-tRNA formyltransferase, partial [Actinomycetota bacterium]